MVIFQIGGPSGHFPRPPLLVCGPRGHVGVGVGVGVWNGSWRRVGIENGIGIGVGVEIGVVVSIMSYS